MIPFFGENVFFWQGVVEDRNDPLKAGRVRVRIIGLHSDNISPSELPVESLPWAQVLNQSASMNGVKCSVSGYVEGTWVMGISRDGRLCQDLVVLGSLAGIPSSEPNINKGFNDHKNTNPIGNRPKRPADVAEHYPKKAYLYEPDVNRLARNEKIAETIVEKKKANLDSNQLFSEPQTPYAAKYPYNDVDESESGHIREVDDTPGNERLHEYHRSGTFTEIHPDGTRVVKVVGDNYEIHLNDNNIHIIGGSNVVIDGDSNIVVNRNVNETIGGDLSTNVSGSETHTVGGSLTVNVPSGTTHNGDVTFNGNIVVNGTITTSGNVTVGGGLSTVGGGDATISGGVKATNDITTNKDVVASGTSLTNHTHTGVHGVTSPPN